MADNRPVWFATFVLLVFCVGGAIGFRIGTHMPGDRGPDGRGFLGGRGERGRGGAPFARGGPPPALPPELVNQLTRELQLDTAQQAQLKTILEERRERFERIHDEARDRFDKEQQDLQAAIRAVLRPDQQKAFENFLERRAPRGRGGRGGPGR